MHINCAKPSQASELTSQQEPQLAASAGPPSQEPVHETQGRETHDRDLKYPPMPSGLQAMLVQAKASPCFDHAQHKVDTLEKRGLRGRIMRKPGATVEDWQAPVFR